MTMPDYDPKSIPILDDIIEEDSDNETVHEKIIIPDDMSGDDGTLDLFNETTADIEIEHREPGIGIINEFTAEDAAPEIDIPDDKSEEAVESALIGYPLDSEPEDGIEEEIKDETENNFAPDEIATDDSHALDQQSEQSSNHAEQPIVAIQSDQTLTLDSIVNDIVSQLMPDLEQQIHILVEQALRDRLPEETIRQMSAENDN